MPPVVNLKPTPIPRLEFRAGILQDYLVNADIPPHVTKTAVEGYLAGDLLGVTVYATQGAGAAQEHATLMFSDVFDNDTLNVDVSDGRSLIEASSLRFAHAVAHSLRRMKVKGYRLNWHFHMRATAGSADEQNTAARYALLVGPPPSYAAGSGPRQLFSVSPGIDRGITYTHYVSRPLR